MLQKNQTAHASNPIARFPKLHAIHLCMLGSLCLRKPRRQVAAGRITPVASSENSFTSTSSSTASPWSDNTSKDPKPMVPNGTFCDVSVSSSSQLPTHSPLGADFGDPTLLDQLEEEVTLIHWERGIVVHCAPIRPP